MTGSPRPDVSQDDRPQDGPPHPARDGGVLGALRRGDLRGATELQLAGLGLTEVPPEVYGLAETLQVLDLGGNALTTLPAEIGRLKALRILFASGNPMPTLPPALGNCPALSQIGFRGCGMREVPAEALPPSVRWLTLTDNALERLPPALGERPKLQKLMLAGNRLRDLPTSLADALNLELMRLSANDLDTLPRWLEAMPRLAWLAYAGNPAIESDAGAAPGLAATFKQPIPWSALRLGPLLGEGASGRIFAADWRDDEGAARAVAVKVFKSGITSDGLPSCEMRACLAAGQHPNVVGGLGRVVGHPDAAQALVMPRLAASWRPLAEPPSLDSCSRDVYAPGLRFTLPTISRLAGALAGAVRHVHARGLLHGDLYAHNALWDPASGAAALSDFGAASPMPAGRAALRRLDLRALGILLGELIERCDVGEPVRFREIRDVLLDPGSPVASLDDAVEALVS